MDERNDTKFDLFGQAKQMTDDATKVVGSAFDLATTTVADVTRNAQSAAEVAVDSYRETIEDIRAQLPTFDEVVGQASRLPGVSVNRASYLTDAFGRKYASKVAAAIETTPARAGLTDRQIAKIAKASIGKESRRTTLISIATGIPGGAAAAATIPADLAQLYGHLMRAIQELSYLYGWRDFVHLDGGDPDPATRAALMLFLGSMTKVERANDALSRLTRVRTGSAADATLRKVLLAGSMQETVDEISLVLGDNITRRLAGRVVDKAIPLAGAVVSGIVTKGDFGGMCNELHRQLQAWGA